MRSFDRIGPETNREEATAALAAENLSRKAARGEPGAPEGSRAFAEGRLATAFLAADMGHTVTWDPPAGLTSVQTRWTCVGCGSAVLQRTTLDAPYGSALEKRCTASA